MQLGMIGLGRMGANLVRRLMRAGHQCVVYDVHTEAIAGLAAEGAIAARSLAELTEKLTSPRILWLMLPAAVVEQTIRSLDALLSPGDILIDGGNSYYREDIARAQYLQSAGIHYLDVGVSGGIWGLEHGYCLMIGGATSIVQHLEPIFSALAPSADASPRLPGQIHTTAEMGYLHCGPTGAGHFVKMIHNGIEYGMMAAIAEGLNILRHANIGKQDHAIDAETTPLADPEAYRYDFDLGAITEVWRHGSVIRSWLLDLIAKCMIDDPDLSHLQGRVSDSGEGRWTLKAALDEGVPVPVLSSALYQRFSSRGQNDFANRVLSALRREFGGHSEKSA